MLIDVRRAKTAIGVDGKQRHTPRVVVGDEYGAPLPVHAHVTWPGAFRRLLIDTGKQSRVRGNGKGPDYTTSLPVMLGDLVDGVQHAPVRMDGEKGWIRSDVRRANELQLPRAGAHADQINAIGALVFSVRADVEQLVVDVRFLEAGVRESCRTKKREGGH